MFLRTRTLAPLLLCLASINLLNLNSALAEESNVRCMPRILDHAIRSFELAKHRGLIAQDANGKPVNLGRNIDVGSVGIRDIHKDAYRIRFQVTSLDSRIADFSLETTIYAVNYKLCTLYADVPSQQTDDSIVPYNGRHLI